LDDSPPPQVWATGYTLENFDPQTLIFIVEYNPSKELTMTTPALPICPQCKQTDQVQKVSSVYGLNTKEWIETRSYTDTDGDTRHVDEKHQAHTALGLKLKPPEKPTSPAHPGILYAVGIFVVLFVLSILCPFAIVPILIVAGVIAESPIEIPAIAGMSTGMLLAVGGLILLLVMGVLIWLGILIKRRYDRAMAGYREKKTRYERQDLPNWESAMRRWNEMYICLRDETVFRLGEQKIIRLDDLQDYLLDPYYRK
jgi:hypothetical protein